MRRFPRLLVVLLVLAILGVAADFAAARLFEARTTQAVQRQLALSKRPSVEVRDFPFLLSLALGRLRTVDVAAGDVEVGGVTMDVLQMTLQDVRVPRAVLLGRSGDVRIERGRGRLRLSEQEVNRLLADRLSGGEVQIDERGLRVQVRTDLLGQQMDAFLTGQLLVRSGRLAFQAEQVQTGTVTLPAALLDQLRGQGFQLPLPELPAGLVPEQVVTEQDAIVLSGRLGPVDIRT
jgi:hypothetical protein